jgi:hypothetical protein
LHGNNRDTGCDTVELVEQTASNDTISSIGSIEMIRQAAVSSEETQRQTQAVRDKRQCSSVVEQRFRKPQVKGSKPFTGSPYNPSGNPMNKGFQGDWCGQFDDAGGCANMP